MPELPEVETVVRTLAPLIVGATITSTSLLLPRTLDSGSLPLMCIHERKIARVLRRGKLILIELSPLHETAIAQHGDDIPHMIAVHLKMTGRLFVYGASAKASKHTRLILGLHFAHKPEGEQYAQLFFDDSRTFGYVRILTPMTMQQWPFWQKLGLEPLEHHVHELAMRISARRSSIKSLLLNQELVVGIGNIYADEALFRAKIRPDRKAHTVNMHELETIFVAVQEVLRLSIEQCGASIRDYRTAHGDVGSFQNTFFVYGRSGSQCYACQSVLQTTKVAGRTTVFCPSCQR